MNIISLGAGVQSSTLTLMAAHGDIGPMPDCAIFADVGNEPAKVYEWLDWLEKQLPFPVHRVTRGNLGEDQMKMVAAKDNGDKYVRNMIPAFTLNSDGSTGMMTRKCTQDYKLIPIRQKIRALSGGGAVSQWIGISKDEAHRQKPSGVKYIKNRFPLLEMEMTRLHCLEWMAKKGYPKPPKSSCIFCPYHSDKQWAELTPTELAEVGHIEKVWNEHIKLDERAKKTHGIIRFHRSCKPILEVDFNLGDAKNQIDMFGNECEGMCGV
jgi:hypothetical protein